MGIQISVTTIVTEIFIPVTWSKGTRKHDQKVGLDFVFWDDREVPVSYSRRSGF